MAENLDLDALEKKTFISYFQDGLLDIYMAILFAGTGITTVYFTEPLNYLVMILAIGIGLIIFMLGKKLVTFPRIGKVKFSKKRIAQKKKLGIIFSIYIILVLVIFIFEDIFPVPLFNFKSEGYISALFIGLVLLTIPMCIVAYFIEFNRLYIHAVLFGLNYFLADTYSFFIPDPLNLVLSYTISGTIVLIIGVVSFVRFVRKYPVQKEEVDSG